MDQTTENSLSDRTQVNLSHPSIQLPKPCLELLRQLRFTKMSNHNNLNRMPHLFLLPLLVQSTELTLPPTFDNRQPIPSLLQQFLELLRTSTELDLLSLLLLSLPLHLLLLLNLSCHQSLQLLVPSLQSLTLNDTKDLRPVRFLKLPTSLEDPTIPLTMKKKMVGKR